MKTIITSIIFLAFFNAYSQSKATKSKVSRNPYYKFELKDANESITCYLSEFDKDTALPLVVYIQGSGYNSLFQKQGTAIVPKSGHINLTYSAKGKAKILLIEKPGVTFLDNFSYN